MLNSQSEAPLDVALFWVINGKQLKLSIPNAHDKEIHGSVFLLSMALKLIYLDTRWQREAGMDLLTQPLMVNSHLGKKTCSWKKYHVPRYMSI